MVKARRHFMFKQGEGNSEFEIMKSETNVQTDTLEFGVYFSNDLTVKTVKADIDNNKNLSCNGKQIKAFLSVEEGDCIWIFDTSIYCFECVDHQVHEYPSGDANTPVYLGKSKWKISAKTKRFNLLKGFEISDVSEMFSTSSGNPSMNRGTIKEFSTSEHKEHYEICESLLTDKKIEVNLDNFIDYLTPTQFETVAFMIFYLYGKVPRSYAGGSRKDIDLEVFSVTKNITKLYQVKKKEIGATSKEDKELRDYLFKRDVWLIHSGKTDQSVKTLGKDWMQWMICNHNTIDPVLANLHTWVKCLFPDNLFHYVDICKHVEVEGSLKTYYLDEFEIDVDVFERGFDQANKDNMLTRKLSLNEDGYNKVSKSNIVDRGILKHIRSSLISLLRANIPDCSIPNNGVDADQITINIKVNQKRYKYDFCIALVEQVEDGDLILDLYKELEKLWKI